MRKAITFMQTGQRLHLAQNPPTPITTESSEPQHEVHFVALLMFVSFSIRDRGCRSRDDH